MVFGYHLAMGAWALIDEQEQNMLAEAAPSYAQPGPGEVSLLRRIRAYLPGAETYEHWGEPSPQVYFHEVHICGFQ